MKNVIVDMANDIRGLPNVELYKARKSQIAYKVEKANKFVDINTLDLTDLSVLFSKVRDVRISGVTEELFVSIMERAAVECSYWSLAENMNHLVNSMLGGDHCDGVMYSSRVILDPFNRDRVYYVCSNNIGEAIMFDYQRKHNLSIFPKVYDYHHIAQRPDQGASESNCNFIWNVERLWHSTSDIVIRRNFATQSKHIGRGIENYFDSVAAGEFDYKELVRRVFKYTKKRDENFKAVDMKKYMKKLREFADFAEYLGKDCEIIINSENIRCRVSGDLVITRCIGRYNDYHPYKKKKTYKPESFTVNDITSLPCERRVILDFESKELDIPSYEHLFNYKGHTVGDCVQRSQHRFDKICAVS